MPAPRSSPQQVPAWALRANEALDGALVFVKVAVLWWLLTLAGLVVLGAAPATVAAAQVMREHRRGAVVPVVRTMLRTARAELLGASARMVPLALVQLSAAASVLLGLTGRVPQAWMMAPLVVLAGVVLGWSSVSVLALAAVPRLRRQDLPVSLRLALLCPGIVPAPAVGLVLCLVVIVMVTVAVPPLGLLLGPAGAIQAAVVLLGARIERLLEDARRGAEEAADEA